MGSAHATTPGDSDLRWADAA